jgi:hypothetical protein
MKLFNRGLPTNKKKTPLCALCASAVRPKKTTLLLCGELFFLLLLCWPSVCYAEPQSSLTPSISASEEYTDNVFLSDDNTQTDWITSVTPGLRYNLVGKNNTLMLSYAPTFSYYDKYSDLNTVRHNASAEAALQLAQHTAFTIRNVFVRTEEPISREEVEDETVNRSREPYYTNTATAEIAHEFGSSDMFRLQYTDTLRDNEAPDEEDSKSHNGLINLIYWFQPHLGIDTQVAYTRGEFSDGSDDFDRWYGYLRLIKRFDPHLDVFVRYAHTYLDFDGETEDYQVYDASIGIDYAPTATTSLSLGAGYFIQDIERGQGADESEEEDGGTLNAILRKTWKHGGIDLTGETGYRQSYFGAENLGFDKYSRIVVSARHRFTQDFSGNISGSYREDTYTETIDDRKDDTWVGAVGLGYQPRPWLTAGLQYAYRERDSDIDINDYNENSVMLTITLTPTRPVRL